MDTDLVEFVSHAAQLSNLNSLLEVSALLLTHTHTCMRTQLIGQSVALTIDQLILYQRQNSRGPSGFVCSRGRSSGCFCVVYRRLVPRDAATLVNHAAF